LLGFVERQPDRVETEAYEGSALIPRWVPVVYTRCHAPISWPKRTQERQTPLAFRRLESWIDRKPQSLGLFAHQTHSDHPSSTDDRSRGKPDRRKLTSVLKSRRSIIFNSSWWNDILRERMSLKRAWQLGSCASRRQTW